MTSQAKPDSAADQAAESVAGLSRQVKEIIASLPSRKMFGHEESEALYGLAYQQALAGQHARALDLFTLLVASSPAEVKYLQGFALMHFELKRFDEALNIYRLLDLIDPFKPRYALSMAECHLRQQRLQEAGDLLRDVIEFCEAHESQGSVIDRARLLHRSVHTGGTHASEL